MKAPKSLEMVGTIHLIIICHIPEDLNLRNWRSS